LNFPSDCFFYSAAVDHGAGAAGEHILNRSLIDFDEDIMNRSLIDFDFLLLLMQSSRLY